MPGATCVVVFMAFVAVYSTYRPLDPNAHILDRPTVWTVPLLEWASLLSLLAWFVCVSLVLARRATWPKAEFWPRDRPPRPATDHLKH